MRFPKAVSKFLEKNGFKLSDHKDEYFTTYCMVKIHSDGYEVTNSNSYSMYTNGHGLFELVGILVYFGFVKRDFVRVNDPEPEPKLDMKFIETPSFS
jgi:hypothetical protein